MHALFLLLVCLFRVIYIGIWIKPVNESNESSKKVERVARRRVSIVMDRWMNE